MAGGTGPKILWLRKYSSPYRGPKGQPASAEKLAYSRPKPLRFTEPTAGYGMGASGVEGHSSPALGRLNVSSFEVIAWDGEGTRKWECFGGRPEPFPGEAPVLEFCGMFPSLPEVDNTKITRHPGELQRPQWEMSCPAPSTQLAAGSIRGP